MSEALDAEPVLVTGATFHEHYEVIGCIKRGGMGAVYEVLDTRTRRRRALKLMRPGLLADADLRARFEREATVTSEIESDHIIETSDAGIDAGTGAPFMVMELLKGDDLATILERDGARGFEETVDLLRQAALGLDRTHAAGIVHRDLKPDNLFVTRRDDGSQRLKVLDFGIAKVITQSSGEGGTRSIGSPLYMSPEQITGEHAIGPRADVYALAQIAYTLLTGEAYWMPESRKSSGVFPFFKKVLAGPIEAPTSRAAARSVALPPAFDVWFVAATARDPSARFESTTALVEALAVALGLETEAPAVVASPPETPEAPPPRTQVRSGARSPVVAIAGGLGLALVLGLVATSATRRDASGVASAVAPAASPTGVTEAPTPAASVTLVASEAVPPAGTSSAKPVPSATPSVATPSSVATVRAAGTGPRPRASASAVSMPSVAATASAAPRCNPPYFLDDTGRKIFKRECLD